MPPLRRAHRPLPAAGQSLPFGARTGKRDTPPPRLRHDDRFALLIEPRLSRFAAAVLTLCIPDIAATRPRKDAARQVKLAPHHASLLRKSITARAPVLALPLDDRATPFSGRRPTC